MIRGYVDEKIAECFEMARVIGSVERRSEKKKRKENFEQKEDMIDARMLTMISVRIFPAITGSCNSREVDAFKVARRRSTRYPKERTDTGGTPEFPFTLKSKAWL